MKTRMPTAALTLFALLSAASLSPPQVWPSPFEPSPFQAELQGAVPVRVTVTNVSNHKGTIVAALYDERTWDGARIASARADANADVVELVLLAPASGKYGVRLYQDVNGDGAMGKNLLGIPTEPFGISNNANIQFGPPSFGDAAFEVRAPGASQSIKLR
jgi:uncharacterized protein (DUF2141 family)